MTDSSLSTAPVLSTPESHIFEEPGPTIDASDLPRLSDEQLRITYEIQRTVTELRAGRWKRIALQFPDHMLLDAPRVCHELTRELKTQSQAGRNIHSTGKDSSVETVVNQFNDTKIDSKSIQEDERLFILADTSYGACCVDEVAAEHADAEVVVHYGRSCLSPTARLPVIYVFTKPPLDINAVVSAFKNTYNYLEEKVIIMADIPYASYIPEIEESLKSQGYSKLYATEIVHNTSSPLPNRTCPPLASSDPTILQGYKLFHIADPPPSLLITLSSRLDSIHIYPTTPVSFSRSSSQPAAILANTSLALRRRYALLTTVATVPVIGILINTLSVRNYMKILAHIKTIISAARKKTYTFVVGKVNAAKVANFQEVGGWVVIGCWESSLFESKDFWKPVVTPFELEFALKGDEGRVWTGRWTSDFETVLNEAVERSPDNVLGGKPNMSDVTASVQPETERYNDEHADKIEEGSEEESEPPEFDLRTGRYVSHTRPMGPSQPVGSASNELSATPSAAQSIIKRANGDLARVGGEVSPAAEFFKNQRSWQGLGSDFEVEYDSEGVLKRREGAVMEEGRKGIARGYTVGDDVGKR